MSWQDASLRSCSSSWLRQELKGNALDSSCHQADTLMRLSRLFIVLRKAVHTLIEDS